MFFAKRAWIYVTRKKSKVVLIGFILLVVSTLILTGLLINSASQSTFEVARNKLGASVTYTSDLSSLMKNTGGERPQEGGMGTRIELPDDYTSITTKEIEYIADNSKYIKNYIISTSIAGEAVDFSYYSVSEESNASDSQQFGFRKNNANINVIGVDTKSKDSKFNSEDNELIDGRYFTDEEIENASNVIIIEQTISTLNNLSIGDTITITKENMGRSTEEENSVQLSYEIVGIYKTNNPTDITSSSNQFMGSFNLTENTMYAPYTSLLASNMVGLNEDDLETLESEIEENGYEVQNVVFNLKDPSNIDDFIKEVKNMKEIDTTYRTLNANDAAYEKMVGPIENVASTSKVLVIVVVVAGIFIIGLILMLSIKDRKYELGVLLSLGESKIKIIYQLITEMIIVSLISVTIAVFASGFISQGVTNYLINQEINSTDSETNSNDRRNDFMQRGFMGVDNSRLDNIDVDTISELTVKVNKTDVLQLYVIVMIIVIVGNAVQASFVLKCNPKEILLER